MEERASAEGGQLCVLYDYTSFFADTIHAETPAHRAVDRQRPIDSPARQKLQIVSLLVLAASDLATTAKCPRDCRGKGAACGSLRGLKPRASVQPPVSTLAGCFPVKAPSALKAAETSACPPRRSQDASNCPLPSPRTCPRPHALSVAMPSSYPAQNRKRKRCPHSHGSCSRAK